MKNKEKFAKELLDIIIYADELAFDVDEYTVKGCSETDCCDCLFGDNCNCGKDISNVRRKWLEEEYVEPTINWNTVAVDTPILVKDDKDDEWCRSHFSKYENGKVYAWSFGHTSWSAEHNDDTEVWKYAKLADPDNE